MKFVKQNEVCTFYNIKIKWNFWNEICPKVEYSSSYQIFDQCRQQVPVIALRARTKFATEIIKAIESLNVKSRGQLETAGEVAFNIY